MKMSRRSFLESVAGAGAAALLADHLCQAAESQIDVSQLEQAASAPVLRLDGIPSPVVIVSIELLQKDRNYFVRVRSKDGAEGVSGANSRAGYLHPIFNQLVAPYFIGKDARDLEDHLFGVYRFNSNYKLQGVALWCPLAWIEFALLDMLGRIAGKSTGQLLGDIFRTHVPFYVASGRRDTTPQQEVEYLQSLIEETGAKAVKFRVGGRMSRNEDALPGRTKALIPLARKTLGDDIAIHADSNSSYDPPQAIEIGRMLEDIQAVFFEEPCPFDHLEDTKAVADALTIPVAGGEQEFSQRRFRWTIHNRAVDIIQPDLHYYGGLIRTTRVARMADLVGMPTTVHISDGLGFVDMLHFASYTPKIGAYQEFKRGLEKYKDWFDPPLKIQDGALSVPQGPGVGIRDPGVLLKDARLIR